MSIKTILLTPLALEAKCSANGPKKQRQNLFFHSINLKEGVPSRYVHLSAEEAEQFSIRLVLTNGTVEVLKSKQKLGGKGCLITIDENAESYEVEKFNHVKEFINATMSDPDVAEGKDE